MLVPKNPGLHLQTMSGSSSLASSSRIEVPPPTYHAGRASASSENESIELPPYPAASASAPAFAAYNPDIKGAQPRSPPADNAAAEAQQPARARAANILNRRRENRVARAPWRPLRMARLCACIPFLCLVVGLILGIVALIRYASQGDEANDKVKGHVHAGPLPWM